MATLAINSNEIEPGDKVLKNNGTTAVIEITIGVLETFDYVITAKNHKTRKVVKSLGSVEALNIEDAENIVIQNYSGYDITQLIVEG